MKADQSTFAVVFETDYEFHYEGFRMYFVTEGNTTTPDLPTTTDRYYWSNIIQYCVTWLFLF